MLRRCEKGLTEIAGIRVGHASDREALTGCTVILCEQGAVAGADVRGSATGTEELLTMEPDHIAPHVHAVVLAGGSAFGLEAASGVRRWLEARGIGFETGSARVPIVPCAIIYDLAIGQPYVRPTREMGEAAAQAASDEPVEEGAVGAGTGATVGKVLGMGHAMKSGIGSACFQMPGSGVKVAALAVVNAFGDVVDPASGRIIAGARASAAGREFADTARLLMSGVRPSFAGASTTLIVVATNAALSKVQARKLAVLAGLGVARTIRPVNTPYDGDLVIALALGGERADLTALGVAAAEAVSEAILRAVQMAPSLGGVPGLKSWSD